MSDRAGAGPPLTAEERRRVLADWNRTETGCAPALVNALVEAQVDRTPDGVAVELDEVRLTYAELDAAANRLAHRLHELGAGPERLVGICLDRSPAMVVAVLAVLKSGSAYVPLDPAYPRPRLAAMLADSRPAVVITEGAPADELREHCAVTLALDGERDALERYPSTRPEPLVGPGAPAYVIYTSGSTGVPKGVVVPHEGVGNLAEVVAREFGTRSATRVLQFANFSFDAWVAELAMTLPVGGTLVLAPREKLVDRDALHDVLEAKRIEVVTLPPSLLAVLDPEGLPNLRTVCSAGELCSWELAARWRKPGRRFVNGYGPTEVTVAAAYHQAGDAPPRADSASVPIGAPLANKRAYVVDAALEPVPPGCPGELVIGGAGIALGYLGRSDLTARSFIPDPFAGEPGARAYRTGDLVRWLPDGVLEFLGRVDDQVKLRGFRIEPGEIDAALRSHPEVRDAVTVARPDRPGRPRLVAYVVGDVSMREARTHLRQRLPDWMVPSAIVVMDELPLTPNGKVDKKALPAPPAATAEYAAPRTPIERVVVEVLADVLARERVGIDDDFFELGGDSLLATRAASRLATVLGHQVPLELLFESPTPAELASTLLVRIASEADGQIASQQLSRLSLEKRVLLERRLVAAARDARAEPIPRRSAGDPSPLSFAQQRLWFIDQLRPGDHTYNAVLPMIVHGFVDPDALRRALDAVVDRHEVMRTVYRAGPDGNPQQVVLGDAHVELRFLDLTDLPRRDRLEAAVAALRREGVRPFDLARDVTTRAALARLDRDEHALIIVSHHICCDGWSRDVLFRDLASFYDASRNGTTPALPELPLQYADYALWQRRWLSGAELERQVAYWRDALAGVPPTLEMPTDRPRPRIQSFRGAFHWFSVPVHETRGLVELGREERATLYQTLLAAYAALVFARSGQDDFLVGSPIANRQRLELEPLMGLFSNTLVVRARVGGDPTFRELVKRIRRATLGAYAHQDLPFEKLVEVLRPPRDASRNPLFQTNFRAQAVPPPRLSLGGAPVEPLELDLATSRFDFAMDLHAETDGSMRGYFEYSTDLFDELTAIGITEEYLALLRDVVRAPDVPISELETIARIGESRALAA